MAALVALLLLPEVAATAGDGVPAERAARAGRLLAEALAGAGVPDDAPPVSLVLHRDEPALEAAGRAPPRAGAAYDAATRTVHAWCLPLDRAILFRDGLPGLLQGALAHEARHAAAHLRDGRMRWLPFAEVEGAADRDAVRWLAGRADPAARAWEWLLASRAWRAGEEGLFADPETFPTLAPIHLPPGRRAVWYAQAWVRARGGMPDAPDWIVWRGHAEPRDTGFRAVAAPGARTLVVRREPGPLRLRVTPLAFGRGAFELLHAFASADDHAAVVLARDGALRAERRRGASVETRRLPRLPAPQPGRPMVVELADGVLRVDGTPVAELERGDGRVGFAVLDGGADVVELKDAS